MCCQKCCFCLNKYYYILIFKTLKLANYKPGSCLKMFSDWIYHEYFLLEYEARESEGILERVTYGSVSDCY